MNLERPKKDTHFLRMNDQRFMQNRKHQTMAKQFLIHKLKEREWTREEFLHECRIKGFMKTPIDRNIVKQVLFKARLVSKKTDKREEGFKLKDIARIIPWSKEKEDTRDYKPF